MSCGFNRDLLTLLRERAHASKWIRADRALGTRPVRPNGPLLQYREGAPPWTPRRCRSSAHRCRACRTVSSCAAGSSDERPTPHRPRCGHGWSGRAPSLHRSPSRQACWQAGKFAHRIGDALHLRIGGVRVDGQSHDALARTFRVWPCLAGRGMWGKRDLMRQRRRVVNMRADASLREVFLQFVAVVRLYTVDIETTPIAAGWRWYDAAFGQLLETLGVVVGDRGTTLQPRRKTAEPVCLESRLHLVEAGVCPDRLVNEPTLVLTVVAQSAHTAGQLRVARDDRAPFSWHAKGLNLHE